MINEGWATSALVGGLKGVGYAAKGVGYVGKNVAKGAANTIGTGTYHLANNKYGGTALATGTGLYIASRIARKRRLAKEEKAKTKQSTKSNNIPIQKKKASWQKNKKKKLFNEMNHNLPGLPTLAVMPNKNRDKKRKITGNPRSVANALKTGPKNYRPKAEHDNIEIQVKQGKSNMLGRMAKTGYDKTLGKISTV